MTKEERKNIAYDIETDVLVIRNQLNTICRMAGNGSAEMAVEILNRCTNIVNQANQLAGR